MISICIIRLNIMISVTILTLGRTKNAEVTRGMLQSRYNLMRDDAYKLTIAKYRLRVIWFALETVCNGHQAGSGTFIEICCQ